MDPEHQPQRREWKEAQSGGEAGGGLVFCGCYTQSCPTLQPQDSSPTGSSDHRIFQARILEWAAISCCRGSSRPKDGIRVSRVSCISRRTLHHSPRSRGLCPHSLILPEANFFFPYLISLSVLSWRWSQLLCLWSLCSSFYLDLFVVWVIQFWPIPNKVSNPWTRLILHVYTLAYIWTCQLQVWDLLSLSPQPFGP